MSQTDHLKIAFVSSNDALDRKSLSGSPYHYADFLSKHYRSVDLIHRFRPNKITVGYLAKNIFRPFTWLIIFQKLREIYWKKRGYTFVWDKTDAVSRHYARVIEKALENKKYDLIVAEKGSYCIAHLNTRIPIVYTTDATFKAMENYYPEFMNPARSFSEDGNRIEKMALEKSTLVIASNHWAAESMVRDYGISPKKIRMITHPGLVDDVPSAEQSAEARNREVCRLLFVGVDWSRKGGEVAVAAVNWLNANGVRSRLTVCGCAVPKEHQGNPHIEPVGYLNKNTADGKVRLNWLFHTSHFFILPTRAECCGQVFAEASACGLPFVTTATGGIASVVREGENGVMLSLEADGETFGKTIKRLWEDPDRYSRLRISSRQVYLDLLCPEVWEAAMKQAISSVKPC